MQQTAEDAEGSLCSVESTQTVDATSKTPAGELISHAPALLIAAVCASLILYYQNWPLGSDVAGQFLLARAMRNGARLYVDLLEINPPLWFWMAMPFDALAQWTQIPAPSLIIVTPGGLVGAVVRCARRLLPSDVPATGFLLYLVLVLLVVPMRNLEQREHLALIAAVPLMLLAAARRSDRVVPSGLALWIGFAASLGLMLKPQFAAVPILLELWLLLALGRRWMPLRPENLSMATAAVLYALAIVTLCPTYLPEVVAKIAPIYQMTGPSLLDIVGGLPMLWLLMIIGLAVQRHVFRTGVGPMTMAFATGFVGFGFAFAVQHKGWLYQGVPATGCLALALAAVFLDWQHQTRFKLLLPVLMSLPFLLPFLEPREAMTGDLDITPALEGLGPKDRIGLISVTGITEWPAAGRRELHMASRFGTYWILAALDADPTNAVIAANARKAISDNVADYRCSRPRRIIFTRSMQPGDRSRAGHPEDFFRQDPAFVAVMDRYQLWKSYGIFHIYQAVSAIPAPVDPAKCLHFG